ELELGGTYVHWYHPHLWSEITRYGLELTEAPAPKKIHWITEGKLHSGSPDEHNSIVREGFEKVLKIGSKQLPMPFSSMRLNSFKNLDKLTVKEYLKDLNLSNDEQQFISSLLATDFNGDFEKGPITQIFRWWGFSNGDRSIFADTVSRFKLEKGMSHLVQSITKDINAEIKMNANVTQINQVGQNVEVVLEGNQKFQARTAVITVPYSTLKNITFTPKLNDKKQAFINEGQVS